MKKLLGLILCLVLTLGLGACGTNGYDDTYVGNTNDFEETSEINSEIDKEIDFDVPSDIIGLIDLSENYFNNEKIFYLSESAKYTITPYDGNTTKGELKRNFKSKEWVDTGKGVYLITTYETSTDEKEWFFIHDEYLVLSNSILLVDEIISGDAKTGFYGGKAHRFNKNGGYTYHPGGHDNMITTTGNYIMLTDNIMKIIKNTGSDVVIEFYFISNSGKMYVALPQSSQSYT